MGNVGKTVIYTDPVDRESGQSAESLKDLVADMRAGKVEMLIILGGNPVLRCARRLEFRRGAWNAMFRFAFTIGLYQDETAELCHWHVNRGRTILKPGATRAPTTAR